MAEAVLDELILFFNLMSGLGLLSAAGMCGSICFSDSISSILVVVSELFNPKLIHRSFKAQC